jgi:hypothetical protein
VILTGILGLIAYVLVGKKRGGSQSAGGGAGTESQDSLTQAIADYKPKSASIPPAPNNELGSEPATTFTPASAPAASEFKPCPDCAEEVRFAARKCRFCG